MRSKKFQTGNQTSPKIRVGGSSDSSVLNKYFESVTLDLLALTVDVDVLGLQVTNLSQFARAQNDTLATMFNDVEIRLSILASGSYEDSVLVDMASSTNVDSNSTATQTRWANQATLPILNTVNLIKYSDVYGNTYVPQEIKLKHGYSDGTELPSFEEHRLSDSVLLGNTPLMLNWPDGASPSETTFYFKLDLPIELQNYLPNLFEIGLLPMLNCKIVTLGYHNSQSPTLNDLIDLDYTYLPGYSSAVYGNTDLNDVSKIRVHLPKQPIGCIVVGFQTYGVSYWGCNNISVKHLEYETSAELIITNPYGNIDSVYIKGKDENDLASTPVVIDSNTATLSLSTNDPFYTPVVTSVILYTS